MSETYPVYVLMGLVSDKLYRAHSISIWAPFHEFAVCVTDWSDIKAALESPLGHPLDLVMLLF